MRTIRCVWLALFVSLTAFGLWMGWGRSRAIAPRELLAQAKSALQRKEFGQAEELALRIPADADYWRQSRLVAGEAAMKDGRLEAAIQYYAAIPRDGSRTSVLAVFSQAEIQRDIGRLSEAEQNYRYALQHQPEYTAAHERMAFLLGVTGRRWESLPHLWFLLQTGSAKLEELALIADLERTVEAGEFVRRCQQNAPDDLIVLLSVAANALAEGSSVEARRLLQRVVDASPNLLAAQTMLGEMLVDADAPAFTDWHARLPASADSSADVWFVRGRWARRQGNLRFAARCFWESIRIEPVHRRSTFQLGQVLIALGESSGQDFANRSAKQFELTHTMDIVLESKGKSEAAVKRVAELLEDTGRLWEANAWAMIAGPMFPEATWPAEMSARLSLRLDGRTPMVIDSANLALKYDLSDYPRQPELFHRSHWEATPISTNDVRAIIRFEEATAAGIDFAYVNGSDPLIEETSPHESAKPVNQADVRTRIRVRNRTRMFEQGGGGVAAFDFDFDGWPDLFFTQGSEWKHGSAGPTFSDATTDHLYRNLGGQSFINVTSQALQLDQGFGQGCAAGDFDNDGFVDLYVANIGRNQLYRNNGDGTFSDVTAPSGLIGNDWTSSCVIADLNADGLPDLFDVNYLSGPHVYEAVCKDHACSPKQFDGTPARLHLNRGDGTFEFVPNATPAEGAKGLGIIVFDHITRGRPSLFIANDQVPNFLLRNTASGDRFNIRLENEGFASGLAFNEDGLAMASMGMAADDVNGDGRIDFFITTFKDEPSILFVQDASGLFVDATKAAGLRGPGLPFVGWGTQFLDADRDGEPDLVAVNGHVDDYRGEGGEYHMRPQFFKNAGGGRFVELFAADVGAFFEQKRLGRGLARLDWNGDGRMDFIVNNIGEQATLVTNESTALGHFVNVRLHARTTARDAIGSVVDIITEKRRWSKQLLAGDGYLASNERLLQFGLGSATTVNELHVTWPSGSVTTLRNIPADTTVELVEGALRSILRHGSSNDSLVVNATVTGE